jgi:hypothetical protein
MPIEALIGADLTAKGLSAARIDPLELRFKQRGLRQQGRRIWRA